MVEREELDKWYRLWRESRPSWPVRVMCRSRKKKIEAMKIPEFLYRGAWGAVIGSEEGSGKLLEAVCIASTLFLFRVHFLRSRQRGMLPGIMEGEGLSLQTTQT